MLETFVVAFTLRFKIHCILLSYQLDRFSVGKLLILFLATSPNEFKAMQQFNMFTDLILLRLRHTKFAGLASYYASFKSPL